MSGNSSQYSSDRPEDKTNLVYKNTESQIHEKGYGPTKVANQKPVKWYRSNRTIVTIVILLFLLFILIVTFQSLLIKQGSLLRGEQVKMESFLKDKYGRDFVVKEGHISNGGDVIFKVNFKTYKAKVSPLNDPSVVFTASRIIEGRSLDGGQDSPDKLNYSDDYLLTLWTHELKDRVDKTIASQPINVFFNDFHVDLAKTKSSTAAFYDRIWGTVPKYNELPLELKRQLTLSNDIKVQGSMNAAGVERYATAMIAIRDVLDPAKDQLDVLISSFEIYNDQRGGEKLGEWSNVGFVKLNKVKSINELTPYFVKWTNRYGKYYNTSTHEFDNNHPQ